MIDQPNEQHGRDILFETLPGDPGAHGPYRERERGPDCQLDLVVIDIELGRIVHRAASVGDVVRQIDREQSQ